jgi:excisionase family DNA binding protein
METTTKLTIKQAAHRFGLSASLLYLICQEKRLPHYRVGGKGKRGRVLIDVSDLEAFLMAQRVEPSIATQVGLKFIKT